MSIPIGNLIGMSFAQALNHMVPAVVTCNRCRLEVAAEDYRDHREKDCPALFPEDAD